MQNTTNTQHHPQTTHATHTIHHTHNTNKSIPTLPFFFSVWCGACDMHCVWWLALSNTLPCCAPSSLLFSFCPSLPPPSPEKTHRGVWREERGRKGCLGKRERKRKKRGVMQKRVEKRGGKKRKRDDDTWCSQVVSNPSTNQARRGLTSLIRREVVLSSWYGRNSLFPFPSLCLSVWMIVEKC